MAYDNVLEAMGNTPLVRLNRIAEPGAAEIYVKFEALNVGGSIKTRTAYNMVRGAEARGDIKPGATIVEPTSGNQGIGLALVGAVLGYDVVIVMPDSVSEERRKLIAQYGARVVLIKDEGDIGKCIAQCLETAEEIVASTPGAYLPQQFTNPDNPRVHVEHTAVELLDAADGPIDGFCSGVGTGGTLSGIGEVLKRANPDITIWAAEPENAAILAGGAIGTHLQMGIGDGLIPDNLNREIYDEVCIIADDEAIDMARRLAREEGLLCGISSGTNVAAAVKLARRLGPGKRVATILPDTGERYYSTALFE